MMGTADYADWCRLGAGCRRLDCQDGFSTKGTKDHKGHKGERECGALPHAPAGEGR